MMTMDDDDGEGIFFFQSSLNGRLVIVKYISTKDLDAGKKEREKDRDRG